MQIQLLWHNALVWVANLGAVGPIAFISIYVLATLLFIPGTVLTLGAGVVFGVVAGSIYVFVGATIGATLAFLVGRYLVRDWVERRLAGNAKFRAIDQAIAQNGFKVVLLTRLSPLFPFNLLNYALGITQVTLKDYALACVGMLPATILYVYIGSLAGSLANPGTIEPAAPVSPFQWLIRILGFVATVAVTLYVTQIARTALQQNVTAIAPPATRPVSPASAPDVPPSSASDPPKP